jgi:glycosyltransferase involved in cell wall biosynthesis
VTAKRKTRVFYRLFKWFFSRFVVTSEAMAKYLEGHGVERARIELIPPAVAVSLRRPDPQMPELGHVIGVVTRLDGPKRLDLFIDVIAELHSRGVSCSGLVVGDGNHAEIYENYAQELELAEIIRFVGRKPDVANWLDRFDVFLMTSSVETFGLAVLEAMARGVPVVAMPCPGGLNDLVERGGVLLEDRDPETAADAVETLLASAVERKRIGSLGYGVAATHTVAASVSSHLRMYRGLLSASAAQQQRVPESG